MEPRRDVKGWGREFQKCILKYVEKPFQINFQPDNAAVIMILRESGMGDPSVATTEWMTGKMPPSYHRHGPVRHARKSQQWAGRIYGQDVGI